MFSRLQHPFTCLLFADARSWSNLSQWDTAVPQESLYFQRNWAVIATHCDCVSISKLLTISWVQNRRSHEGSKVVMLLPFSVWLSAIHNQEIQQPLYLKKYTYIYRYIYILHFVFGSCSTRCFRISAISIRCFLHGRLVQREFSRAFWYKQSVP